LPVDLKTPRYQYGKVSVPKVSVSAARVAGGDIDVALVNLDPDRPAQVSVAIAGAKPQHVSGNILTGPAMDSHNTFEDVEAVHPVPFTGAKLTGKRLEVALPPKSVVVLSLD
jgi:alpha-N-arabinofuranosidase